MPPSILRADDVGIYGDAAVDCAHPAFDPDLAVFVDRDVGNLRHEGAKELMLGHTSAAPFAQLRVPRQHCLVSQSVNHSRSRVFAL
jgi:hypothetical protein